VPHPYFNIIKARRRTTCNLPSCKEKFQLGVPICCIGHNAWFHVPCAIEYKVQLYTANDFVHLRTQIEKFALDSDMATIFHKRLETRNPSIFCGAPGSGKSTSLIAFVKLVGSAVNETYVYNADIAPYAPPPARPPALRPFPPLLSLAAIPPTPLPHTDHPPSRRRSLRFHGVPHAKTFHSAALSALRSTTNALGLMHDNVDTDIGEMLDETGDEIEVCNLKVLSLINSRYPLPSIRALTQREVRPSSSPTATASPDASSDVRRVCADPHGSPLLGDRALLVGREQHLHPGPPKWDRPARVRTQCTRAPS
jgi:hypothetical protein